MPNKTRRWVPTGMMADAYSRELPRKEERRQVLKSPICDPDSENRQYHPSLSSP